MRDDHLVGGEGIGKVGAVLTDAVRVLSPSSPLRPLRQRQHRIVVHVRYDGDLVRRVLDGPERHLLRTAQGKELGSEPARSVVGIGVDALVDDRRVVTCTHQRGQKAGVVASPEHQELVGGDHRQSDGLGFTSTCNATSMKESPY